jgi:tRNA(Ile)-lysidine synthetase-like protein
VLRSFEWLRFARPRTISRFDLDYDLALPLPGATPIPHTASEIALEIHDVAGASQVDSYNWRYTEVAGLVDADLVSGPLRLRNWRPGDHLELKRPGRERIKTLFQEFRIPLWQRHGWPVITLGEEVIWARRFGVAASFALGETSRRVLRITERVPVKVE